eukprot:466724_1
MGNKQTRNHDHDIIRTVNGIVLLGAGSVGKSTIFKMIQQVKGVTEPLRPLNKLPGAIRNNCVCSITRLIDYATKSGSIIDNLYSDQVQLVVSFVSHNFETEQTDDVPMKSLADAIHTIWNHEDIQDIYRWCVFGKYAMYSNMDYFFNKIDLIMSDTYFPSNQDYFKLRDRTTGLNHTSYYDDMGNEFCIIDVGGQRGERKKWFWALASGGNYIYNDDKKRCPTDCIFVVALDQFCKCLFEDESANALMENLQLFKDCLEHKMMRNMQFILFFTKLDLFKECLKVTDLSMLYGERYKGIESDRARIVKPLQRIMNELLLFDCGAMVSAQMSTEVMFLCGKYCGLNELFICIVYQESLQFIKDEFLKINEDKARTILTYEIEFMNEQQMENVMKEIEGTLLRKQERLYSSLSSFCAAPSSQ